MSILRIIIHNYQLSTYTQTVYKLRADNYAGTKRRVKIVLRHICLHSCHCS